MNEKVAESVQAFLGLAEANKWVDYDAKVLDVCNDQAHIEWASTEGLMDTRPDARDLAISIFEQTHQPELAESQTKGLEKILAGDESLHLRRKAAFALFKYGDRSAAVIGQIKDAVANDDELKEIAQGYLSQL